MIANLSDAAFQLILDYEVGGGREYYDKFLIHPTWPEGESGVTIGIGYDLGYTSYNKFVADWKKHLPAGDLLRLVPCLNQKAETACLRLGKVSDISIPWEAAIYVFGHATLPEEIALTARTFPGSDKLPADAFGALVSLVYNRGASMQGYRRLEMREIRDAIQNDYVEEVPKYIRAMKRLWATGSGLNTRREAEAILFEKSLTS